MEITIELIRILTCQAFQNDRLNLSFVTDELAYSEKMARNFATVRPYSEAHFFNSKYKSDCIKK